jgi:hypothetical protein
MNYTERDEKHNDVYSNDQHDRDGEELTAGHSSSAHKLPGTPASDDDSPLGDTDQHSDA